MRLNINNKNPIELLDAIYLGDRCIKKIVIDGWNKIVKIQIDNISIIQEGHKTWNYYCDEDIEDGYIVFKCVKSIKIVPLGSIADDYIVSFKIVRLSDDSLYVANMSVGGTCPDGHQCEVTIDIIFSGLAIEPVEP